MAYETKLSYIETPGADLYAVATNEDVAAWMDKQRAACLAAIPELEKEVARFQGSIEAVNETIGRLKLTAAAWQAAIDKLKAPAALPQTSDIAAVSSRTQSGGVFGIKTSPRIPQGSADSRRSDQ